MKKLLLFILALVLLAAFSCKRKQYPEPVAPNESPFYTRLLINGQPLEIKTGQDGYYMYSSFDLDSSNVYNLVGEFKKSGCTNCTSSIRFQINDTRISSAAATIGVDSALRVTSYPFLAGNNDLEHVVTFGGTVNKLNCTYLWDFGDGTTSTDLNPVHTFKTGKYTVRFSVNAPDGGLSIVTNTLSLLAPGELNAYVTASTVMGVINTLSFTPNVTGGKKPYTCLWEFGDGTTATSTLATVGHKYNIKGGYSVKLKVTDATGKSINCLYNAVAGNDASALAANLNLSSINYTGRRQSLSKTSIRFTDASGKTFTSDNEQQPPGSSLDIVGVEDFVNNESGQPVKKIKLKFNCTLYKGSESITLQGTEVTIGVAYK